MLILDKTVAQTSLQARWSEEDGEEKEQMVMQGKAYRNPYGL